MMVNYEMQPHVRAEVSDNIKCHRVDNIGDASWPIFSRHFNGYFKSILKYEPNFLNWKR